MNSRLGVVGAVVLQLLGVVAMYSFRQEEPSPTADDENNDRDAAIADHAVPHL